MGPQAPIRLVDLDPLRLPGEEVPILVVGGGIAGLSAAVASAETVETLVLLKGGRGRNNTMWAQGGVAAVLGDDDSLSSHVEDTLAVGAGLGHPDVVAAVIEEGAGLVDRWLSWGGQFDRDESGVLCLAREGGHSAARIVHAQGDQTGAEIQRLLVSRAQSLPRLAVREETFVLDLIRDGGAVKGVMAWSRDRGFYCVWAGTVILATGGAGRLYRETTNPPEASGDGVAMAYRCGATVRGMEFVQFHPTALYVAGMSRFLVSETARGEGALLRDRHGYRFMPDYHEDAELAPRDVVSRSIVRHLSKVRDSSVYLDFSHLDGDALRSRFPVITQACQDFGLDLSCDPIPVHPACHYMVGGVVADIEGRTGLEGFLAAGEVASTGFHGANRLGSNSLLEGAVCGWRAGKAAAEDGRIPDRGAEEAVGGLRTGSASLDLTDLDNSLRAVMWRLVGIERDTEGLAAVRDRLLRWGEIVEARAFATPPGWVLSNKMTFAALIAQAASLRTESRGTHFRRDHPSQDDEQWKKDLCLVRPDQA